MEKILTPKEYERMCDELDKVRYKCKCGHKNIIPKWKDKTLCTWCHCYVFKDKKKEFEYRVKEKLK